ncbi:MAG: S24/S26 family peptidase, partial [Planctomycetota bacterium]|nr:S24/S26 family peptidase [Planctomycetota bacterium]
MTDRIIAVKVTGNSMKPFINNGEIVLIKQCLLNDALSGDIVAVYSERSEPILHNRDNSVPEADQR